MIQLYYAYTDIIVNSNTDDLSEQLPFNAKSKLQHYKKDTDKHLLLASMVLLLKLLKDNGCIEFQLKDLEYTEAGRPFFPGSHFDFNISHTDNCAAVVFSKDCRLGIDIEKILETDFADFTDYFTPKQWNDIYSSTDKLSRFYYYWTLFESAVKADGRGLSIISEKKVKLVNSNLFIENTEWFCKHYNFDSSISCCITADKNNELCSIKNITVI
jgi:4'-phosphopantetheinyl transferase